MDVSFEYDGLYLTQTCFACPEQYDVFASKDDTDPIGYLRLRHGNFTAQLNGPSGPVVYSGKPEGDGIFIESERDEYLSVAVRAIKAAL